MRLIVKLWPPNPAVLDSFTCFGTLYHDYYRAGIEISMIVKHWPPSPAVLESFECFGTL